MLDPRRIFPSLRPYQNILNTSCSFTSCHQTRWNLGLTLRPPPLNKTGNLPPCHLTTLPSFLPCHLTSPHLSQIATSLSSHLSDWATSLFSHLSHLATSLNSYTFPTFPVTTLQPFPAHLPPTANKSCQNRNVISLGRQGKHVWLIVRQPLMKAGWWDAPLSIRDLAKAISVTLIMGGSPFCFYESSLAVKFLP